MVKRRSLRLNHFYWRVLVLQPTLFPWHFSCLLPLCVESVACDEPLKLRWLRWRLKGRRCVWKRGPWGRRPRRLERSFVDPDASPSAPEAGQRMEFPKDATLRSPHAKTVLKSSGFISRSLQLDNSFVFTSDSLPNNRSNFFRFSEEVRWLRMKEIRVCW